MGIKIKGFKKGVSPVVATVLLVVMVIIIGLIIFLWFRSFTGDALTKFGGRNIELVCGEVQMLVNYDRGEFSITNLGNVPIYSVELKITEGRSHSTESITDLSSKWKENFKLGLRQGQIFSDYTNPLIETIDDADEVLVIPVLIGTSSEGDKTHICDEKNGEELVLN